jgi:hypothetical protein
LDCGLILMKGRVLTAKWLGFGFTVELFCNRKNHGISARFRGPARARHTVDRGGRDGGRLAGMRPCRQWSLTVMRSGGRGEDRELVLLVAKSRGTLKRWAWQWRGHLDSPELGGRTLRFARACRGVSGGRRTVARFLPWVARGSKAPGVAGHRMGSAVEVGWGLGAFYRPKRW